MTRFRVAEFSPGVNINMSLAVIKGPKNTGFGCAKLADRLLSYFGREVESWGEERARIGLF